MNNECSLEFMTLNIDKVRRCVYTSTLYYSNNALYIQLNFLTESWIELLVSILCKSIFFSQLLKLKTVHLRVHSQWLKIKLLYIIYMYYNLSVQVYRYSGTPVLIVSTLTLYCKTLIFCSCTLLVTFVLCSLTLRIPVTVWCPILIIMKKETCTCT